MLILTRRVVAGRRIADFPEVANGPSPWNQPHRQRRKYLG